MASRVKMVLLALAGLNALCYQLSVHKDIDRWPETGDVPSQAKLIVGLSLSLWISVIFVWRFIMYWPPI